MSSRMVQCIGFTGQGSQWVGMGKQLLAMFPKTKIKMDEVNSLLGYSLSNIMFSGPEVRYNKVIKCIGSIKEHC